jgi:energy-coupling factor transport system permease protein
MPVWNNTTYTFHIAAWGLWLVAAMLVALSTRNPLYLLLTIAVAVLVNRSITRYANPTTGVRNQGSRIRNDEAIRSAQRAPESAIRTSQNLLLRTVIALAFVIALFKGLSYHIGSTVIFTLPDSLPVLGGPITLEGLTAAGLDGLSILTVLAVFTAFSAGADYYAMLRSVPPFMHQVALVTSIAITFVPQTVTRFGEIREAQALRGHRVRSIGDLVPLVMPLLAGGMERSMNLAEAMEARGFSRASASGRRLTPILVQLGLACGLGLVLVGSTLFAFAPTLPWLAWLLIAIGLLLVSATLRAVGTGLKRTRYRRTVWRNRDTPLTIASLGIIVIVLTFKFIAPSLLSYNPFPRISTPSFDPIVALIIVTLLAPAIISRIDDRQLTTDN